MGKCEKKKPFERENMLDFYQHTFIFIIIYNLSNYKFIFITQWHFNREEFIRKKNKLQLIKMKT